ncbi:hypothetical protein [Caldivirga maquilingensis]|nr:hypothetical protein [Caldivirga maquilingensis]
MLIREINRGGTRGSEYAYVMLNNELVHVSEAGKRIRCDGDLCVYEVLANVNYVYFFSFSRSGYSSVVRCLPGDYPDIMIDNSICEVKDVEEVLNTWLRGIKFRIRDPELNKLLNELNSDFAIMSSEVKSYWGSVGGVFKAVGHAARFNEFLKDPRIYYFTGMSIPNDNGRVRSIKVLMSIMYENWVAMKTAKVLGVRGLIRRSWEANTTSSISMWFEQGSDNSFAILDTTYGPITMWIEFQWDPAIHVFLDAEIIKKNGKLKFIRKPGRKAVRPDIVLVKGAFDNVNALMQANKDIDVLIECKTLPYNEWASDADEQVMQYLSNFRPKNMALITRYGIPINIKNKLTKYGIRVIDNVKPSSMIENELSNFIQNAFSSL